MKRKDYKLPYESPGLECFGLDLNEIICNSPNRPGGDLPWYPGDDDEDEF